MNQIPENEDRVLQIHMLGGFSMEYNHTPIPLEKQYFSKSVRMPVLLLYHAAGVRKEVLRYETGALSSRKEMWCRVPDRKENTEKNRKHSPERAGPATRIALQPEQEKKGKKNEISKKDEQTSTYEEACFIILDSYIFTVCKYAQQYHCVCSREWGGGTAI